MLVLAENVEQSHGYLLGGFTLDVVMRLPFEGVRVAQGSEKAQAWPGLLRQASLATPSTLSVGPCLCLLPRPSSRAHCPGPSPGRRTVAPSQPLAGPEDALLPGACAIARQVVHCGAARASRVSAHELLRVAPRTSARVAPHDEVPRVARRLPDPEPMRAAARSAAADGFARW